MLETLLRSLSLLTAVLFAAGAVHKLRVVRHGEERFQPLIARSRWRRAYARALLVAAGTLEAAVVGLLVAAPALGLAMATVVLVAYASELAKLPPSASCGCLSEGGPGGSARFALIRNSLLAGASGAAAVASLAGVAEIEVESSPALGITLLALALPAALAVLARARMPIRVVLAGRGGHS